MSDNPSFLFHQKGAALVATTLFVSMICVALALTGLKSTTLEGKISRSFQTGLENLNDTEETLIELERYIENMNADELYGVALEQKQQSDEMFGGDWLRCGLPASSDNAFMFARFISFQRERSEVLNDRPDSDDISYQSVFFVSNAMKKDSKETISSGGTGNFNCDEESGDEITRIGLWEMQYIFSVDRND